MSESGLVHFPGPLLRDLRAKKCVSQRKLEQATEIARSTIARIETSDPAARVTFDTADRLIKALDAENELAIVFNDTYRRYEVVKRTENGNVWVKIVADHLDGLSSDEELDQVLKEIASLVDLKKSAIRGLKSGSLHWQMEFSPEAAALMNHLFDKNDDEELVVNRETIKAAKEKIAQIKEDFARSLQEPPSWPRTDTLISHSGGIGVLRPGKVHPASPGISYNVGYIHILAASAAAHDQEMLMQVDSPWIGGNFVGHVHTGSENHVEPVCVGCLGHERLSGGGVVVSDHLDPTIKENRISGDGNRVGIYVQGEGPTVEENRISGGSVRDGIYIRSHVDGDIQELHKRIASLSREVDMLASAVRRNEVRLYNESAAHRKLEREIGGLQSRLRKASGGLKRVDFWRICSRGLADLLMLAGLAAIGYFLSK